MDLLHHVQSVQNIYFICWLLAWQAAGADKCYPWLLIVLLPRHTATSTRQEKREGDNGGAQCRDFQSCRVFTFPDCWRHSGIQTSRAKDSAFFITHNQEVNKKICGIMQTQFNFRFQKHFTSTGSPLSLRLTRRTTWRRTCSPFHGNLSTKPSHSAIPCRLRLYPVSTLTKGGLSECLHTA